MRELTALEIEQFDFTGRVPELNVASPRAQAVMSAKKAQRQVKLNMRPAKTRRLRVGVA